MPAKRGIGGQNAVSIDEHRARGTYRSDRHVERPILIEETAVSPAQKKAILRGLGTAGKAHATAEFQAFIDFKPQDLTRLRLTCEALDRVAELRATIVRDGLIRRGRRGRQREHPLAGALRAEMRGLLALMRSAVIEKERA